MTEDFEKMNETPESNAASGNQTYREPGEAAGTPYREPTPQAPQSEYHTPQPPYGRETPFGGNYRTSYQQQSPYQQQPSYQQPYRQPSYSYQPPYRQEPPKKNRTWLAVLLVSLIWVAVIGAVVFFFNTSRTSVSEKTQEPGQTKEERADYPDPQIQKNEGYTGEALEAVQIYQNNVESVVFVKASTDRSSSLGSGFVIDAQNGYVLTNHHVVKGATTVEVTLSDKSVYKAEVVGGDEVNDVAVLKINAQGLKQVTIGNSDNLKIGYDLYVIGNPLGDLTQTFTRGIVSGLNREITTESEFAINTFQTDAAINSGNSGGPAFDPSGAVVGIASAKYAATGVEGICFCIPINDAMEVAEDLIAYGYVKGRPNFGITVSTSQGYSISYDQFGRRTLQETTPGAVVEEIGKDSAAEKAGLRVGDIITKLGETKVTSATGLLNAKNQYKAGDTVTLEVYRDGETVTLTLTFDEYSPD